MTFSESISSGFQKYATFQGRASRSEFWWWVLFTLLVGMATTTIDRSFFPQYYDAEDHTGLIGGLASLALLLPNIAMGARRLHDRDRSGWWLLIFFVPLIGAIVLFIWFILRGTDGPNRFGVQPE